MQDKLLNYLKTWWCTVIILPFVLFSVHQVYLSLGTHILWVNNYSYVFPYNIIYFLLFHFDLLVHEAGHGFFSITGNRFWTILGGSLYQVFFPALLLGFCWYNRYRIGIQLSLVYMGFSWMSVAIYAGDAAGRQLPLIGNLGKEAHDWHNIFMHLNILDHYALISGIFAVIGGLCYLGAIVAPIFHREYESHSIDLKM
ncbi:MAG: hypothetical protein LAT84_09750 [Balneolia bacterium]|nr:hypothetical protein [Balneolia bacterium]